MAAAQAAAEAAMRDAVARERVASNQHQAHQQQTDIVNLLQLESHQELAQATAAQHLLNEMMGLNPGQNEQVMGDTNMDSILEIMAQHEQQQQQAAQMEQEQMQQQLLERPTKHFMTIAEDGELV